MFGRNVIAFIVLIDGSEVNLAVAFARVFLFTEVVVGI